MRFKYMMTGFTCCTDDPFIKEDGYIDVPLTMGSYYTAMLAAQSVIKKHSDFYCPVFGPRETEMRQCLTTTNSGYLFTVTDKDYATSVLLIQA